MVDNIQIVGVHLPEVLFSKTSDGYDYNLYQISLQLNQEPSKIWLDIFSNLVSKSTEFRKLNVSPPIFKEDRLLIKRTNVDDFIKKDGYLSVIVNLIEKTNQRYAEYVNKQTEVVKKLRIHLIDKKIIELDRFSN